MKAFKINAADRKVEEIQINDWRDIAPAIGGDCGSFEAPITLSNEDTFYVDEEGLFHSCEGGWLLKNYAKPTIGGFIQNPILGNAVIQGTDDEGSSIEPKSTIEEIEAMIVWVSKEECEAFRNRVPAPRVYGF